MALTNYFCPIIENMNIHREGYGTLLLVFGVLVALNAALWNLLPQAQTLQLVVLGLSAVLYLFFQNFFRNPNVVTQIDPAHVIAPANGKIVIVEKAMEDEYLKSECIQISIFMSPLDVHVNRMPVGGKICYYRYHQGKYLVAWHPKSSLLNERTSVAVESENGKVLLFRQIAGAVARRICCYVKEGEFRLQGQEMGFIKFGSRVDVFLPLDAEVRVKVGDRVVGGESVLAHW
jgi:phosphatidylserine decarboxylase